MQAPIPIVIDTREQTPLKFGAGVVVSQRKLDAGDYGTFAADGRLLAVVERKSHADAWGSVLSGRERFKAEWKRLAALRAADGGVLAVVLLEVADFDALAVPPTAYHTASKAAAVVGTYRAWSEHFAVPVVFCGGREAAAVWIHAAFTARHERHQTELALSAGAAGGPEKRMVPAGWPAP